LSSAERPFIARAQETASLLTSIALTGIGLSAAVSSAPDGAILAVRQQHANQTSPALSAFVGGTSFTPRTPAATALRTEAPVWLRYRRFPRLLQSACTRPFPASTRLVRFPVYVRPRALATTSRLVSRTSSALAGPRRVVHNLGGGGDRSPADLPPPPRAAVAVQNLVFKTAFANKLVLLLANLRQIFPRPWPSATITRSATSSAASASTATTLSTSRLVSSRTARCASPSGLPSSSSSIPPRGCTGILRSRDELQDRRR
jgi:hypothetical protein